MEIRMIVRADDFGITHSCNLAVEECFNKGILTCAGIMAPSPWAEEAAKMARANPHWCVGAHLTTIGEWRGYRLKPMLPYNEVNTLVDDRGFLHQSPASLYAKKIDPVQLEREFTAQLDILTNYWGVKLGYVDFHYTGGHKVYSPEYRQIAEKVAKAYELPVSFNCGETRFCNIFSVKPGEKNAAFLAGLDGIEPGLWVSVHHLLQDDPESRALVYFDPADEQADPVVKHRSAEAAVLTNPEIKERVKARGVKLISYRDI